MRLRYANVLIPYIRLSMRLPSLFLSEWKENPNMIIWRHGSPPLPPSDFVHSAAWIATWSDSVCRIRSHSQPHDKSHAVSGHMESPSYVDIIFDFCRITHNACRLRLRRIWNPSFKLGFHIRGKRKRLAAAECGCGMRYANDLIPYIRLPMRLHSLFLCEWKETPNYDVIFTDSPTSAIRFCTFCRINRYMERSGLPHTQPFAAARQIACRIRTYGITLVRLHAFPCLPDNA